jgi:hypothetical protein
VNEELVKDFKILDKANKKEAEKGWEGTTTWSEAQVIKVNNE